MEIVLDPMLPAVLNWQLYLSLVMTWTATFATTILSDEYRFVHHSSTAALWSVAAKLDCYNIEKIVDCVYRLVGVHAKYTEIRLCL